MTRPSPPLGASSADDLFADGGETGRLMRERDWADSPLGAVHSWPKSLRTCVRIVLTSRQPMFVWWGPALINLYNDAYRDIVGGKHPQALGQPAAIVWQEIWDQVGPRAHSALRTNRGTYDEALLLIMQRHGYQEETYYTFSYSPVPGDDGASGGIICANTDETQRIVDGRRLAVLREIAARTAAARTWRQACDASAAALATEARDLPYALIYLLDEGHRALELAGSCGISAGHSLAPVAMSLGDGMPLAIRQALAGREVQEFALPLGAGAPCGAWSIPPARAAAVPVPSAGESGRAGVLVVALNPFRPFDDRYRDFLVLVSGQVASAIANAQAYEDERRRAEALSELDRAKTAFFSNVSHEFRTPLTLMLAPLEDSLADGEQPLPPRQRERQEILQRNAQRLLKLVNSLLDFSRIEAGRMRATYERVDLAALTADLASGFRSTLERAGLELRIDCPPLDQEVHVDRDMWEKVVLNLLSNAFKHTFQGVIAVTLRQSGDHAELAVSDTGVGIAPEQMPRLFERFHRVQGARARSHEGTGIGLALVQELVKLHGGTVGVTSAVDQGSVFTVRVRFGTAHIPRDQLAQDAAAEQRPLQAASHVAEAGRWLPTAEPADAVADGMREEGRVLLADDNADMRDYVRRLLGRHWRVTTVADGAEALAAIRADPPDLVLTDVMMPKVDGFGLVAALRADERIRHLPVILLSARAGEESSIEGLASGADDYLTKPFSAHELVARVRAHLDLKRRRDDARRQVSEKEQLVRMVTDQAGIGLIVVDRELRYVFANPTYGAFIGRDAVALPGCRMAEILGPLFERDLRARLERALGGERVEFEVSFPPGEFGAGARHFASSYTPSTDPVAGPRVVAVIIDITERKRIEQALRQSEERFRGIVDQSLAGIAESDGDGAFSIVNARFCAITGYAQRQLMGMTKRQLTHPDDQARNDALIAGLRAHGSAFEIEKRYLRADGAPVWVHNSVSGVRDAGGALVRMITVSIDISGRKRIEETLRHRTEQYATLLNQAPVGVYMLDADLRFREVNPLARPAFAAAGEPVIGRPFDEVISRIRPLPYATELIDRFRHTLLTGEPHEVAESTPYAGAQARHEWRIDRITLPDGRFGVVCYFRDITRQIAARDALARHAEELRRANAELEHFASIASHDLQEPLRMISSYSDLLLRRYDALFDARGRTYFTNITRGVERMRSLIHALLSYSQVGRQRNAVADGPLERTVAEALENLEPQVRARDARIAVGWLPTACADHVRLTQLFQNLIANAIKFTPPARRPEIAIRAEDAGAEWSISVADHGIGIPESAATRIFQIFQRLHPVEEYPGSGIGLATCKRIVEQHGGRIWVESVPGSGSTFHFTLAKMPPEDLPQ